MLAALVLGPSDARADGDVSSICGGFTDITPTAGQLANPASTLFAYAMSYTSDGSGLYGSVGFATGIGPAGVIDLTGLIGLILQTGVGEFDATSVLSSTATGFHTENQSRVIELNGKLIHMTGVLAGISDEAASMTIVLNQVGGAGDLIQGTYIVDAEVVNDHDGDDAPLGFANAPEPAMIGVLGVGLLGLSAARHRQIRSATYWN